MEEKKLESKRYALQRHDGLLRVLDTRAERTERGSPIFTTLAWGLTPEKGEFVVDALNALDELRWICEAAHKTQLGALCNHPNYLTETVCGECNAKAPWRQSEARGTYLFVEKR